MPPQLSVTVNRSDEDTKRDIEDPHLDVSDLLPEVKPKRRRKLKNTFLDTPEIESSISRQLSGIDTRGEEKAARDAGEPHFDDSGPPTSSKVKRKRKKSVQTDDAIKSLPPHQPSDLEILRAENMQRNHEFFLSSNIHGLIPEPVAIITRVRKVHAAAPAGTRSTRTTTHGDSYVCACGCLLSDDATNFINCKSFARNLCVKMIHKRCNAEYKRYLSVPLKIFDHFRNVIMTYSVLKREKEINLFEVTLIIFR